MENKPQNVFEKLSEQVEDISKKLEGVSISDLYALAKRTWDYGDYQTAQKYYNHISLLSPLDWEAPLYASLCNFKGYHDINYWSTAPEQEEKIFLATFDYINNLDLDDDKKQKELSKCVEIIKNQIIDVKRLYLENKDVFDDNSIINKGDIKFVFKVENLFFKTYEHLKNNKFKIINFFCIDIADELLDLIEKTKKISESISKEFILEISKIAKNNYNFNIDEKDAIESEESLSDDEIKEIKLKGKLYFEYDDKVISKRRFKWNLVVGILQLFISIIGIVISIILGIRGYLAFIISLIDGTTLVYIAVSQKNRIKCSSFFSPTRIITRLNSHGNIVQENKFELMLCIKIICFSVSGLIDTYCIIGLLVGDVKWFIILIIISFLLYCFGFRFARDSLGLNGTYTYYYKGKIYKSLY